jgi:PKD repeat protein
MKIIGKYFALSFFIVLGTLFWSCNKIQQAGPPPVADFDFVSNNNFSAPSEIRFTDKSTNAKDLKWNFSDGTSSTEKTVVKQFSKEGSFVVTLDVRDEYNRRDTKSRTVVISAPPLPVADFDFSSNNDFFAPSQISFFNKSTNAKEYKWDFNDGSSSNEKDPVKTFAKAGSYNITLNVVDALNRRSSKNRTVIVNSYPPPAIVTILTSATNGGVAPCTVTFTVVVDNANKFVWTFGEPGAGDDNTASVQNASHTYRFSGEYTATLSATGPGGTVSKDVRVTIR